MKFKQNQSARHTLRREHGQVQKKVFRNYYDPFAQYSSAPNTIRYGFSYYTQNRKITRFENCERFRTHTKKQ